LFLSFSPSFVRGCPSLVTAAPRHPGLAFDLKIPPALISFFQTLNQRIPLFPYRPPPVPPYLGFFLKCHPERGTFFIWQRWWRPLFAVPFRFHGFWVRFFLSWDSLRSLGGERYISFGFYCYLTVISRTPSFFFLQCGFCGIPRAMCVFSLLLLLNCIFPLRAAGFLVHGRCYYIARFVS